MSLITISEEDLRMIISASFETGYAFWNVYKPKTTQQLRDKMDNEKEVTIRTYIKYAKSQEEIRLFMENKKGAQ